MIPRNKRELAGLIAFAILITVWVTMAGRDLDKESRAKNTTTTTIPFMDPPSGDNLP